jgi:hypothetical protein
MLSTKPTREQTDPRQAGAATEKTTTLPALQRCHMGATPRDHNRLQFRSRRRKRLTGSQVSFGKVCRLKDWWLPTPQKAAHCRSRSHGKRTQRTFFEHIQTRPCRTAQTAACVRSETASFRRIFCTCSFTVSTLIVSERAISLFESPRAM